MAPGAGANYETGKRVDCDDFVKDPTGSAIVHHLNKHGLLYLYDFQLNYYSYDWAEQFYENARLDKRNRTISSKIKGRRLTLTIDMVGDTFKLNKDGRNKDDLTSDEMTRIYREWFNRPDAKLPSNSLRKAYPLTIYMISDIVGTILMCKVGNKDRFTYEQLRLIVLIMEEEKVNWANELFDKIYDSVVEFQSKPNSKKMKFARILSILWRENAAIQIAPEDGMVKHTRNKHFTKKSLRDAATLIMRAQVVDKLPAPIGDDPVNQEQQGEEEEEEEERVLIKLYNLLKSIPSSY